MKWRRLAVVIGLLTIGLVLIGCRATPTPTPCPDCPVVTCPTCPTPEACPECPTAEEVGLVDPGTVPAWAEWAGSAHGDGTAVAFTYWDGSDAKEVPVNCAQCHSTTGYQTFVAGIIQDPTFRLQAGVPIGEVVTCNACHSQAAQMLSVVPFPSGITMAVEGPEARCMVCHQGRAAGASVDASIARAGLTDEDTVSPDLGFTNIHFLPAASTLYGTWVKGGYEYPGKTYSAKFDHVEGYASCLECHDPHTLEVKVESCYCHGFETVADARDLRELGSLRDYDGDGNATEGIYYEIKGLQEMLYGAIQAYALEVSQAAILYNPDRHPYFFGDANANGILDEGEGPYRGWTARLAKAAYNYQVSKKDPGGYAHNGKYLIELLYDSIENLNEKLATPVDLSRAHRSDAGHFDAAAMAFRYWDAAGAVPAGCVKCHQAEGLPQFLANAANISMPPTDSLWCTTCHDEANWPARYATTAVTFPSGRRIDSGSADSNLCLQCHQGRSSTVAVNAAVGSTEPDDVIPGGRFLNIHYFAAAATLFGNEAQGAYQYAGKEYVGRFTHVEGFANCSECHDAHSLLVREEACRICHPAAAGGLTQIRMATVDYDGDGDTAEGLAGEIATLADALYAAILDYAAKAGAPIQYNPYRFPYFLSDPNANGVVDEGEGPYTAWTPRLLRAAYNYQYVLKDPGAYSHNASYVLQFLYDSIEDLGGDVSRYTRP